MKELFKIMQNKPHTLGLPMVNFFWTLPKGMNKAFSVHPIKTAIPTWLPPSPLPCYILSMSLFTTKPTAYLSVCFLSVALTRSYTP